MWYLLLIGKMGIVRASKSGSLVGTAKTATCFGVHNRTQSFYCNNENGEIRHYDFNMNATKSFQKGFPGSDANNQGFTIMGNLLISWRPVGSLQLSSTAINIWQLTTPQQHLTTPRQHLQTLYVKGLISSMHVTPGVVVVHSKEDKKFHVLGFAA